MPEFFLCPACIDGLNSNESENSESSVDENFVNAMI